MHQPIPSLSQIVPQKIDKDFVCQQILEIADMARECHDYETALRGMTIIASIKGMLDDNSCD